MDEVLTSQVERVTEHIENNKLTSDRLYNVQHNIEDLRREQVIEEHFYINDDFRVPADNDNELICFEEFNVPAGKTLDFAASFNGFYWKNANSSLSLRLY